MARLQVSRKAIASTPEIGPIRLLSRGDLAHLTVRREATVVQTLRDNHHRIARAVASGMASQDVAATCGITINRVSVLKADPAFADLVAHYRAIITTEWAQQDTVIEFMRSNALKAQAMISDKLDDAVERNEFLPTRDLLGIAELGLDRTGYGKVNKNVNINVDFAAKLEAARNRSAQARVVNPIEGSGTAGSIPATRIHGGIGIPEPSTQIEAAPFPNPTPQSGATVSEPPRIERSPPSSFRRL